MRTSSGPCLPTGGLLVVSETCHRKSRRRIRHSTRTKRAAAGRSRIRKTAYFLLFAGLCKTLHTPNWSGGDSNPRPLECDSSALPAELPPRGCWGRPGGSPTQEDSRLAGSGCQKVFRPSPSSSIRLRAAHAGVAKSASAARWPNTEARGSASCHAGGRFGHAPGCMGRGPQHKAARSRSLPPPRADRQPLRCFQSGRLGHRKLLAVNVFGAFFSGRLTGPKISLD